MPYYCTVPRCTSMAGKAKNVSFHQFPRDEELAKLWNRILKRGKPYTKYSKVCSLHFKPEDYTITSVGKNKGQWRTLRKDAIPSQNLPSESPVPYTRRSSGCWVPSQPNITDPLVQQQMAQAIYMQTMLAMQAAGVSESLASAEPPQTPESTKPSPSGSSLSEIELLLRKDPELPKDVTYKCHECTKCFKDPDVFLLHKRTHKKDTTLNVEKENYSANIQDSEETLRANPILANLLKTSMRLEPESSMNNILTVENQIMAALASNMEAYIRTLSSMISNQTNAAETDKDENSDYEEEAKDENNVCEEDSMCADANDDTPMDEDGEDTNEMIQDENNKELEVSVSVNRLETSSEDHTLSDVDDNSKDETYEAHNDAQANQIHNNVINDSDINVNDNHSREEIEEASNDSDKNEINLTLNENKEECDAFGCDSSDCASNDKLPNNDKEVCNDKQKDMNVCEDKTDYNLATNEAHHYKKENALDENLIQAGADTKKYETTKNEVCGGENETLVEERLEKTDEMSDNAAKDGMDNDNDVSLARDTIDCDSAAETVELLKVVVESKT